MRYIIKAQGYDPHGVFSSLKDAEKTVRTWVKEDMVACRQKFGTAITCRCATGRCWEVFATTNKKYGPMWSRYTIHEVQDALP